MTSMTIEKMTTTRWRLASDWGRSVNVPSHDIPEISIISLDPETTAVSEYLKGAFDWHIDGSTDVVPNMAAIMSAKVITAADGGTEFASAYAAYEDLEDAEKERYIQLRVLHSIEASQRWRNPNPTSEKEAFMRSRPNASTR